MLKITLYKNCKLNDNYQNVLSTGKLNSNGSSLDNYLNSLIKYTFEVDCVYQERNGTLVFDYNILTINNIYEYNYMKIETIEDETIIIKRYCFINDIILKNALVYLTYKEDIWSSYSDKIKGINKSLLSNSYRKKYSNELFPFLLPISYNGNEPIKRKSLFGAINNKYYLFAEVQVYSPSAAGRLTTRNTKVYLVCDTAPIWEEISGGTTSGTYVPPSIKNCKITINKAISLIRQFYYWQSHYGTICSDVAAGNTDQYEVIQFKLVPANLFDDEKPYTNLYYDLHNFYSWNSDDHDSPSNKTLRAYLYVMGKNKKGSTNNNLTLIKEKILECDFKDISIGTFNIQIPIENNGTNRKIRMLIQVSEYAINFYININNVLVDLTNNFIVNYPYGSVTAEKFNEVRIARETRMSNLKLENISNGLAYSQKVVDRAFSMGANDFKISQNGYSAKNVPLSLANQKGVVDTLYDTANLIVNTKKIGNLMKEANAPVYSSQFSIKNIEDNFINIVEGICIYYIDSDNDEYVNKAIEESGYKVFYISNNYDEFGIQKSEELVNQGINFDVIKFDVISIYGEFPASISKLLEQIFESGVKIWYIPNIN